MLKLESKLHKANQESYALVFKALLAKPHTCHELVEVTGLHIITVQSLMRTLARHEVVHITGWLPNSRDIDTTPYFKLGPGKNVPRRSKTRAEIAKAYRMRKLGIVEVPRADPFAALFQLQHPPVKHF